MLSPAETPFKLTPMDNVHDWVPEPITEPCELELGENFVPGTLGVKFQFSTVVVVSGHSTQTFAQ